MWIGIAIVVGLAVLFMVLWVLNPKENLMKEALEEAHSFMKRHELTDKDKEELKQAMQRLEKAYEEAKAKPMCSASSCARLPLNDAYEHLRRLLNEYERRYDM